MFKFKSLVCVAAKVSFNQVAFGNVESNVESKVADNCGKCNEIKLKSVTCHCHRKCKFIYHFLLFDEIFKMITVQCI